MGIEGVVRWSGCDGRVWEKGGVLLVRVWKGSVRGRGLVHIEGSE